MMRTYQIHMKDSPAIYLGEADESEMRYADKITLHTEHFGTVVIGRDEWKIIKLVQEKK